MRSLARRFLLGVTGCRFIERQTEARGQPLSRRQCIGALTFERTLRGKLQEIVKALPLGLCERG